MKPTYCLEWLGPGDAGRAARLERLVYPRRERTGRRDIHEQLSVAEAAGENLSAGLFAGPRLVGYSLRFLEADRRRICTYLGIAQPPGIELSGPGIYMADIAVHPDHRRETGLLIARMAVAGHTREDLRELPMEAVSTRRLAAFWTMRIKALARVGLRLVRQQEFHDADLKRTLCWLQFEYRARTASSPCRTLDGALKSVRDHDSELGPLRIGILDRVADWPLLEPHWDRLLARTPGATVFYSYAFLSVWWRQLVLSGSLLLIVVLAGDVVRAIAPMQIVRQRWLGREYRCLGFLGQPTEVDRPVLIAPEHEDVMAQAVADHVMGERDRWDCAIIYDQPPDSPFLRAMALRLRSVDMIVTLPEGPACPSVEMSGDWTAYLAGRSRAQRRSGRRHEMRLRAAGTLAMETCDCGEHPDEMLERYARLEERSWKPAAGLGVAKTSTHLAFWRTLVRRYSSEGAAHFRFLVLDGQDIAATFGLLWNRCFYSLHIVHDQARAHYSPGFVLTQLELQEAFRRGDYRCVDYLGGFLSNKRGWATHTFVTTALYAHPRDILGRCFHGYYFRLKPCLKRQLSRLGVLDTLLDAKKALATRCGWYRW